jgi:hypothetical protein
MRLRRNPAVEMTVEHGLATVTLGVQVMHLSEVSTTILEAVTPGETATIESVVAHVVATLGPPPPPLSADEITTTQINDLIGHDVLVVEGEEALDGRRGETTGDAVRALREALRALETGTTGWTLPAQISPDDFLAVIRRHHVESQVARGVSSLDLSERLASRIRANGATARVSAERVADDVHRAFEALSAAGIRALMIKGLALSALAWQDEWARGAGDIDLLVAPVDMPAAYAALAGAGWRPQSGYPAPGPSWAWRHFMRTDNELPLTGSHSTVDLHFFLVPARSTFPSFERLWQRRHLVEITGQPVATLGHYDALTHSAGHAAKDHWRWLRGLLDIHRLVGNPRTWAQVDRPLRTDQLLSVGIAGRLFGVPDGAPQVVHRAAERAEHLWPQVDAAQQRSPYLDVRTRVPGAGAWRVVTTQRRTGATPLDHARQMASLLMPPAAIADLASPHASQAVPQALLRRGTELLPLWRRAAMRSLSRRVP